ncbi:hypothetical protein [Enterobacter roggenkampii]|uniref:hypothetical protein n=1 Tax=Enterobacter roggenkampii TaxID=1812935 RepID=UPI003EBB4575
MTKQDKATAAGVSVSALNTSSRAAVAQNFGTGGAFAASQARTAAITADHNAQIGAQLAKANQTRTQQQIDANKEAARGASLTAQAQERNVAPVGISAKNAAMADTAQDAAQALANAARNAAPVGTSLKNIALAKTAAAAQTPSNSSINMAVSSIPANTPVTATINGTVTTTTAGSLAKIDPQAQVAMPVNSAFSPAPRKGGHDHNTSSSSHGGTGNGSQNAANSRSGMAHGFGDNHVGGGSAQSGSRSVGKW